MEALGGSRNKAQTTAYMTRNLDHWAAYGFGLWLLRDTETADVIGRALLRHLTLNGRDEVEVGYSFMPAFWARGLAPEIAGECLRYGRHELGLASIVALTAPGNARSRRVLSKIGMVYDSEVFHEGSLHVMYRTEEIE